jgi:hypothetical protein
MSIKWKPGYYYHCFITRTGDCYGLDEDGSSQILFDCKFISMGGNNYQFVVSAFLTKIDEEDKYFLPPLDENLGKYKKLEIDAKDPSYLDSLFFFSEQAQEKSLVDRQKLFCKFFTNKNL